MTTRKVIPKFGMRWYSYNPAFHLAATLRMTADEKAKYYDEMNQALIMEQRGINPEADKMMDEAYEASGRAKHAADIRWEKEKGDANAMRVHCNCNALPTDRPTKPTLKPETEPKKPEQPRDGNLGIETREIFGAGSGGDKYARIKAIPQDRLAEFAAQELQDADPTQAVFAYKWAIGIIGPEAFRSLIAQFIGEIAADECATVRKLGALFMSKFLKPAIEAKRKRGAA